MFDYELYKVSAEYRKAMFESICGFGKNGTAYNLKGGYIVRHNNDGSFTWIK